MDIASTAEKPHKTINWGGVLKGVAIVAAVAVAAVVVGILAQAAVIGIGNAIAANTTATALASTAGTGVGTVSGWLLNGLQYAGNFLTELPGAFVNAFGLSGSAAQVTAGAQTAGQVAAIAAGGATVAVGAHAAHPYLNQIDYTQTVSGTTAAMQGAHTAHAAHMAEMAHMSHHAAEHTQHQSAPSSWMDRFTSRGGTAAGFADTVASRKPIDIAPRDGNFAAQVETDTTKLNKELGL